MGKYGCVVQVLPQPLWRRAWRWLRLASPPTAPGGEEEERHRHHSSISQKHHPAEERASAEQPGGCVVRWTAYFVPIDATLEQACISSSFFLVLLLHARL